MWFRQDLRLADNPALTAAAADGRPVVALHVLDETLPWAPGAATLWWLHHSLAALGAALAERGVPLILRRGPAARIVPEVAKALGAGLVAWNRTYEPAAIARDTEVKQCLTEHGIAVDSRNGALLVEPWTVKTGQGGPFRVFTPFWRAVRAGGRPRAALPVPALTGHRTQIGGDDLADWHLLPTRPDWAGGLREAWQPGEAGAAARLVDFVNHGLGRYAGGRDRPDQAVTSRLSPHLHFGEISPVQVWHAAQAGADAQRHGAGNFDKLASELGWREFAHHLLFHFPTLPDHNYRADFDHFPWRRDAKALRSWQQGRTGYPLVDAGMRELWATGFIHNRVRMVVASFLIKHLLLDWRAGEAWFWDTLVDADLANNAASWQWVAGCGADAAPYFRIFNPVLQGEKFDPLGSYVRQWVPEVAGMPDRYVHRPWEAPDGVLNEAGVTLGRTYPKPMINHDTARKRALQAFAELKKVDA